ncbi:MFS transporter [Flavicella sp.]|uniref:MFS transporter n=1 Tax=Flavicella sp. TaxID=2957742 RepID=UPI0030186D26
METINKNKLFLACCIALITTSMTFAIRVRLETVFGHEGVGLTLEQIGYAFTPAFWGFTLAMIIGGSLVDSLGIKKNTWIAFIMHAIGIIWTLLATSMTSLFMATLFVGIGNGMIEAALNPMIASMYPKNKNVKSFSCLVSWRHCYWLTYWMVYHGCPKSRMANNGCFIVYPFNYLWCSILWSKIPCHRTYSAWNQ